MDRNVGVDLSFFKGRINFTADYYNNRTDDVLEYLTVPLSTGRRNVNPTAELSLIKVWNYF